MAIPPLKHLLIRFSWPLLLLLPLEAFSQTSSEDPSEDRSPNSPEDSLNERQYPQKDRELGIGLDLYKPSGFIWAIDRPAHYFNISYKRSAQHLSFRGGLGFRVKGFQREGSSSEPLIPSFRSNIGVEKSILKIDELYSMSLAADLTFLYRPVWGTGWAGIGPGLALINELDLSPRSSLSLEVGLSYFRKIRSEGEQFSEWGIWFSRPFTLSYHYRF